MQVEEVLTVDVKDRLDPDIRCLDLEAISFTACRLEGWSLAKVERIEMEYRAYLQVVRYFGGDGDVAPSLDVDKYWHHHILDTTKYMNDCQVIFGGYLHHYPYSGVFGPDDKKEQSDRVSKTRKQMKMLCVVEGDRSEASNCTSHCNGQCTPACSGQGHCVANNKTSARRPTRDDMLSLLSRSM